MYKKRTFHATFINVLSRFFKFIYTYCFSVMGKISFELSMAGAMLLFFQSIFVSVLFILVYERGCSIFIAALYHMVTAKICVCCCSASNAQMTRFYGRYILNQLRYAYSLSLRLSIRDSYYHRRYCYYF